MTYIIYRKLFERIAVCAVSGRYRDEVFLTKEKTQPVFKNLAVKILCFARLAICKKCFTDSSFKKSSGIGVDKNKSFCLYSSSSDIIQAVLRWIHPNASLLPLEGELCLTGALYESWITYIKSFQSRSI